MLRQLGIDIELRPSTVSIGIGADVVKATSQESLANYQALLTKHFPDNGQDVARIIGEVRRVMDYMDVLYGIDNPLFLDLKSDPSYVVKTILPWMIKYALTMPKVARLALPVDEHLAKLSDNQALLDMVEQHFFKKTPAFFALSYFTLYLDYRYPWGGTGAEILSADAGGEAVGAVLVERAVILLLRQKLPLAERSDARLDDDVVLEIKHALEVLQRHVEQKPDARG